ncbi:translocating chain-associated membrane protein 1-like, partial [Mizuhopecten yessoensis]
MGMRRGRSTKNPPIFSHEFFIQNHADIVSCIAMVFVVGLMFQATAPVATLFVALQHNVTRNGTDSADDVGLYTYGRKDIFSTMFYLLICVVVHAVIQEYVLDKLNRKMHLSKVKHSKFNESGQL